jgi:uncharacterized protein
VAVQLAVYRPVAALVLITPYDSILAIAKRRFRSMPVSLMLKHRFESVKYAAQVAAPVLVLRAESDDVVPHLNTDLLVSKLATVLIDQVIPGSNHRNIPYLPETQQRIADFLCDRFFSVQPEAKEVVPSIQLVKLEPEPGSGN